MTVDLSALIADQEAVFWDQCLVTGNPGGHGDDILDPTTLQLNAGPATQIYSGPCSIRLADRQAGGQETPSEAAGVRSLYVLKLPLTQLTSEPAAGHTVVCTASEHDPGLTQPGLGFTITAVRRDTYAVARVCEMEMTWASV